MASSISHILAKLAKKTADKKVAARLLTAAKKDEGKDILSQMIRKYAQPYDDFDIPESGKDLEGEWRIDEESEDEMEYGQNDHLNKKPNDIIDYTISVESSNNSIFRNVKAQYEDDTSDPYHYGDGMDSGRDMYEWEYVGFGGTLTRGEDGKSIWIQGDEAKSFNSYWDQARSADERNTLGEDYDRHMDSEPNITDEGPEEAPIKAPEMGLEDELQWG